VTVSDTAATANDPLKIDIWSDVQCPWCYIGKRRFEAAVETSGVAVDIEYHSFELAPDTPVEYDGTPMQFLSVSKGLPLPQIEEMLTRVTDIATSLGLDYDYEHIHQTNTVKAHELLHYAKAHGRQLEMKERLLEAYFVKTEHIGRIDDLADIAASIGFDRADVVKALDSREYLPAVKADMELAMQYGIQGVPFFVIDGKYGVSGAQESETFANVLSQALTERDA
jgi:predicted DsbA family dithiol-disulfide isomerase